MKEVILIITFLAGTSPLYAKEKITIEVVDAVSLIRITTSNVVIPASPAQSVSNCVGISSIYLEQYGITCTTSTYPLDPSHLAPNVGPSEADAARAILPDGTKVFLFCDVQIEGRCKLLAPKDALVEGLGLSKVEQQEVFLTRRHYLGSKSIGIYKAERDGNKFVVWGPQGKSEYHIVGSWTGVSKSEE